MQLKIAELLINNMTNKDYLNDLATKDIAEADKIHTESMKISEMVNQFPVAMGYPNVSGMLASIVSFFSAEAAISAKRISDLEEQVKALVIRLEEKNAS